MDPTPEPTSCRGIAPDGPDCPTTSPAVPPAEDSGVVQPDGAGVGSGVSDVLATVLDVVPWLLVVLLLAAVAALLADRARRSPAAAAEPREAGAPVAAAAPPEGGVPAVDALPRSLVDDLLVLADLGTTPAVASQVRRVLRSVSLEPIEPPPGTPFDLDQHEVVATSPVGDPVQHERVARVHRPGWRRGSEVLRPAAVELWVMAPPPPNRSAPPA